MSFQLIFKLRNSMAVKRTTHQSPRPDPPAPDERQNNNMNPQSLSDLVALGEGFTTEFKRAMPSNLGREICALATFVYVYCISKLN